jgi:hypothetical protein
MTRFQFIFSLLFLLAAIAFIMMIAVLPVPAHAGMCGNHERIVAALVAKYQEAATHMGTASEGGLIVEFYETESGSTWTLLSTEPGGLTCIIAAGQDWTATKPEIAGEKS